MKKLLSLVAIAGILFNQSLSAQEESIANKVFYTEIGGAGVIMSANFDSRFKSNERLGFGYRIGVGFGYGEFEDRIEYPDMVVISKSYNKTYYSIPAGLNYVFGKPNDRNTFEVGAGVTFLTRKTTVYPFERGEAGNAIGHLSFMYRIMPLNGGFSFRIGFTPIIGTGGDLFPSGTVGFGYVF